MKFTAHGLKKKADLLLGLVLAHGANLEDLVEVYSKQIRCILEFGVPVWNPSLTKEESYDIERVQKAFLHIALGNQYLDYENALVLSNLHKLEDRRLTLCKKLVKKSSKHDKSKNWFKMNKNAPKTRSQKPKFLEPIPRLTRYSKSPIPYLTWLLNKASVRSMYCYPRETSEL